MTASGSSSCALNAALMPASLPPIITNFKLLSTRLASPCITGGYVHLRSIEQEAAAPVAEPALGILRKKAPQPGLGHRKWHTRQSPYGALLVAVLAVTNEEEAYSGDWIGVLGRCWRINNWRSYILLKGGAKCTHGGQRASRAWSHVLTCPVLNRSDRQALVLGIA